eukprot:scaffold48167_cov68-Phaeocystis_antarctica.AAC.2
MRAKVRSTRTGAHPAGASRCEEQVRSARSEEHLDAVKPLTHSWVAVRSSRSKIPRGAVAVGTYHDTQPREAARRTAAAARQPPVPSGLRHPPQG